MLGRRNPAVGTVLVIPAVFESVDKLGRAGFETALERRGLLSPSGIDVEFKENFPFALRSRPLLAASRRALVRRKSTRGRLFSAVLELFSDHLPGHDPEGYNFCMQAEVIDSSQRDAWLEAFDAVVREQGRGCGRSLLERLMAHAQELGLSLPPSLTTPYVNTIPLDAQPPYPGDRDIERRIKNVIRWNAMAMVAQANKRSSGIGGHISTYASCATLFEVGFNHFFRGPDNGFPGDQVFFQGHAAPGVYARAFVEGRIAEAMLHNFRRELAPGGGLASYPHPRLMPHFWQFPTVSMGLSPISAIYQARFNRYLQARGLIDHDGGHVWAFLGDGEMDEPESLGALTLAAREQLDNLTFVINCNLQRLDGPVRGNGKIIQELEAVFRGAGWNVIKVIWGDDWDPLLARDDEGLLVQRMNEVNDGQYQKYTVESGAYIREHFFGVHPKLLALVEDLTDAKLRKLRRGGHDPEKVFAAYRAALEHRGAPTVILAKTIKGYGLGESGEGRNVTHQQKKLTDRELRHFRDRLGIPISDADLAETPFYRPPDDSEEMEYLFERRRVLGGFLPQRRVHPVPLDLPPPTLFAEFLAGTGDREVATTMVMVRLLRHLMNDPQIGRFIVPIVPDEARTFGMDALFRKFGIYSAKGQLYEPVDSDVVAFYREATDGQLLEEGITEAGSMASFQAAGTAYATHGVNTIPVLFLLFDLRLSAHRRPDLAERRRARQRVLDRRHRGPYHAGRRRPATPGRPQSARSHHDSDRARLRPGLRARDRGHRRGRHPPHVRRRRERLLLPHRRQRDVHASADAGGRARRHHPRLLQAGGGRRAGGVAARALVRQRRHRARGAARPGAARAAAGRSRRMERHQLLRVAPRCSRGATLEHAAPAGAPRVPYLGSVLARSRTRSLPGAIT